VSEPLGEKGVIARAVVEKHPDQTLEDLYVVGVPGGWPGDQRTFKFLLGVTEALSIGLAEWLLVRVEEATSLWTLEQPSGRGPQAREGP
jgi:hypothetical protein